MTLSKIKERGFDPLDYRYHCLTAHYRKQLDFSWEALESAKTARRRLREAAMALKDAPPAPACADHVKALRQALEDDLNAPAALAALWDGLRANDVPVGARLSLLRQAEGLFQLGVFAENGELPQDLIILLAQREQARNSKDFALSDQLRRKLEDAGILVEDTKQGQKWRRK